MTVPVEPFFRATGHDGFRADKYYLFSAGSVTVMAGWPRMQAWKKSARQPGWRRLRPACGRPDIHDLQPCGDICARSQSVERSEHCRRGDGDCAAIHDAWSRWSDLIPRGVRDVVREYQERHWHLLSLAARCGEPAIDLMRSNPALAWALASSWVFREKPVRQPMRAARSLLAPGKSQRDILAWLDFPSSESARRVLRKLQHDSIRVNTLLSLRDAMRDPLAMKHLAHLPVLNHGVVRLLADAQLRPFCTPTLLREVALHKDTGHVDANGIRNAASDREARYAETAMQLRDCIAMLDYMGVDTAAFTPVRSMAEVRERHDRLVRRQVRLPGLPGTRAPLVFPPPPLAGTDSIQPLATEPALIEEGVVMQHCVASRADGVCAGRAAIYRVLAPERATVEIRLQNGRWQLAEVRLFANGEPSSATRSVIERWLALSQRQRGDSEVPLRTIALHQ